MANKKITEYTLVDEVSGDESFLVDDGIQSYRATSAQLKTFVIGSRLDNAENKIQDIEAGGWSVSVTAASESAAKTAANAAFLAFNTPITPSTSNKGRLKFYWQDQKTWYTWDGSAWEKDLLVSKIDFTDMIKTGIRTSSSDNSETFTFDTPFVNGLDSDIVVVANRMTGNSQDILPITSATKTGFTINRFDGIDGGQDFFFIAINGSLAG